MPLSFDQIPSQLLELLYNGFDILRRVLLSWHWKYSIQLNCHLITYAVDENMSADRGPAPEHPTVGSPDAYGRAL